MSHCCALLRVEHVGWYGMVLYGAVVCLRHVCCRWCISSTRGACDRATMPLPLFHYHGFLRSAISIHPGHCLRMTTRVVPLFCCVLVLLARRAGLWHPIGGDRGVVHELLWSTEDITLCSGWCFLASLLSRSLPLSPFPVPPAPLCLLLW